MGAELAEDFIRAVSPALDATGDPAARLATGFRLVMQQARARPLLPHFMIRAGWPATDRVSAFSGRLGSNLAEGIARGRFRTASLPSARALVGDAVIGMMAALIEEDAGPARDAEMAMMQLLALGLAEQEARSIAELPLPGLGGGDDHAGHPPAA